MSKRRKAGFYIRAFTKEQNGESGFFFQKVSGWVKTFKASDGFRVRIGFICDDEIRWWHLIEISTGLLCGGAETFGGAEHFVKEHIDMIAQKLQEPKKVRFAQELEYCLQFSEEDKDGRKFPENYSNRQSDPCGVEALYPF